MHFLITRLGPGALKSRQGKKLAYSHPDYPAQLGGSRRAVSVDDMTQIQSPGRTRELAKNNSIHMHTRVVSTRMDPGAHEIHPHSSAYARRKHPDRPGGLQRPSTICFL